MRRVGSRSSRAQRGSPPILALALAPLILSSAGALGLTACRKQTSPEQNGASSAPDTYADGKRLASSTSQFLPRWRAVQTLPNCASLLPEPEPRARCEAVLPRIEHLRAELARTSEPNAVLPALADVALAAERAAQALRDRGVEQLFEAKPSPPASASAAPPSPAPSRAAQPGTAATQTAASQAAAHRKTLSRTQPALSTSIRLPPGAPPLTDAHDTERAHSNPVLDAITEYRRVATLALRQMGAYLEHGPLPVRERAFAEFKRLAEERAPWTDLKNLLHEAELLEATPELKKQLRSLRERLG